MTQLAQKSKENPKKWNKNTARGGEMAPVGEIKLGCDLADPKLKIEDSAWPKATCWNVCQEVHLGT